MKKPSKQIILLLIVCSLIILAATLNKFWWSKKVVTNIENTNLSKESSMSDSTLKTMTDITLLDTDKDNLPDWQEILQNTDKNKTDTDGDGTNDGAEVKLNRDPTIAGPNDQKVGGLNATTTAATGDNDAKTISESIARKLFSSTVYLSTNNLLTEEAQQNIINEVVNDLQNSFLYKEYPIDGLTYITNETTESYKFYGEIFASLQVKMVLEMNKQITNIQRDFSVLGDIYAKQANDLYTIKVPKELAETHLKIVNNFSKSAEVYRAIANEKKDPLLLPMAIRVYSEATEEQGVLMLTVANFFRSRGIIYTSSEAGDYWNSYQQNF